MNHEALETAATISFEYVFLLCSSTLHTQFHQKKHGKVFAKAMHQRRQRHPLFSLILAPHVTVLQTVMVLKM